MEPIGAYADDLRLALEIADEVDSLTAANFASEDLTVELKPDDTPVTAIDREAERLVRARIAAARPDDAFVGEEYGATGDSTRQWIVDPIDGTKNYIRAVPVWATLIALVDRGEPVVGVVSAPALGRRWFAAAGAGAWGSSPTADVHRLSVSSAASLAEASLSYSSLSGWEERGLLPAFLDLTRSVWRTRAYGDFWSYMMVAEGQVDLACEPELALHDMAALVPIVQEAGGRFTSLAGEPGPFGADALATNGMLHDETLRRLRG
ncbi:inositol monophosphatase family protein [Demequina zhanjiangensis]|uniref:Inositol monophosphatase family protein n=1 Tax=Demequina zhanjiangensis TaxID=3051659 RepID=A0ABT8FXR6_9MICO|nr:inositol monophosphatase family protein [Demequina sp. SYSU T00b26]MDN4471701.1 inositol monophosphatase family protein [Demequina sp. SYSU T00b26]